MDRPMGTEVEEAEDEAEAEVEEEEEVDIEVAEAATREEKRSKPWSTEPSQTDLPDTETTTTTRELRPMEEPLTDKTEPEEDTNSEPREATEKEDGDQPPTLLNQLSTRILRELRLSLKLKWNKLKRQVRREEEESTRLKKRRKSKLTTRPTLSSRPRERLQRLLSRRPKPEPQKNSRLRAKSLSTRKRFSVLILSTLRSVALRFTPLELSILLLDSTLDMKLRKLKNQDPSEEEEVVEAEAPQEEEVEESAEVEQRRSTSTRQTSLPWDKEHKQFDFAAP